jgi:hypothetical protein
MHISLLAQNLWNGRGRGRMIIIRGGSLRRNTGGGNLRRNTGGGSLRRNRGGGKIWALAGGVE